MTPTEPNTSNIPTTGDPPTASLAGGDTAGTGEPAADVAGLLRPPQADGEIGRLGGYRVLRVLGRGGMGVVFLAEDPGLARQVALKAMLPGAAADPAARERFLREARAAAMVKDDHVVTIHQVSEDNGVPFLVMELLSGESLAECIRRRGRLPPAEVLRVGRQLALGLAAAHARGLQHRDVKPANAWVEAPSGRVKLLDFGLARAEAGGAELTRTGAVLGTPAYMAPEQARGEPTDPRADLFSLGVVLYELTTGDRPFRGNQVMAVLLAVAQTDPVSPHRVCPDIPSGLSALITRLLAKKTDDRPASATEVAAELEKLERAGPPRRVRRRLLLAAAVGLPLAVAAAILIGRTAGWGRSESNDASPEVAPPVASGPQTSLVEPDPEEDEPVKAVPPVSRPAHPIDALQRATHVPANRSQAPAGVVAVVHDEAEKFTVVAFGPDGKHFAAGTRNGQVKLWDIAAWKERALTPLPKHPEHPNVVQVEFSPDGKFVAAATDKEAGSVHVWDVGRGAQTGRDEIKYADRSLAFSRAGGMFATAGTRIDEVRLYDVGADGRLKKRTLENATLSTASVVFTPEGDRLLAFGTNRNVLRAWDPKMGKAHAPPNWWPKDFGAEPHSVVFSPGGNRVAFPTAYHTVVYTATAQRPKLREFDPPLAEAARNKFRGDPFLLTNVAFGSEDGKIVAGFADGSVRLCQFGPGGGSWRTVCDFAGNRRVAHVAFSPEGRHVAAVSAGDVYIIRLPK